MSKLILTLDGAFLGEHDLSNERTTIGRRPSNDIHIDNLAVSGEHASIMRIGNDAFLEDLGSTNGTLVNGKQVAKHVLQHGDVIEFGKYQLKYVLQTPPQPPSAPPPEDFEKTMIIRPSSMRPVPAAPSNEASQAAPAAAPASDPAAVAASTEPVGRLQILSGPSAGKELVLTKALTTLGKPGVQVAVITKRPQGYFVTHVEGQNYPNVNGSSVGSQAFALKDHDVLELAGVKMEFYVG